MSLLRQPSRALVGDLGDTPALLTRACNGPFSNAPASATKRSRSSGLPRSAVMWWVQFGSRLHSSGTASREHVMIRQAASLKRLTVAWPIPRLAPVSSKTFLSALTARPHAEERLSAALRSPPGPGG